jgi:hypothetical protein
MTTDTQNQPTLISNLARQLLLLGALERRVKDGKAAVSAALKKAGLEPGTTLRPLLADDRPAGNVQYTVPGTKALVADEKAFADWVQATYPANVELVVTVRPAFADVILALSQDAGQPVGPGGEVGDHAPAGIRVGQTPPQIRAVPDRARAAELWAAIRSDPDGLLMLPADPAGDEPAGGAL